ncbi:MAG: FtsW/RodA/SpoVE family cell cycle protein [Bacteroidales bacterium]|nr:FtsW/RodA/SpoVE family cell cycle protein [Bacteroidales bacterium]
MSRVLKNIKGDKVIWAVVILLSVFSLLAVYSSTGTLAYKFKSGNTEYYMIKHFIILVFGFSLIYFTHRVKYIYFSRIFQIAFYVVVPLLIITLFIGVDLNDARRGLLLPFNLTFQTSDLAKLTLIVFLSRLLSKKQDTIKSFKTAFVPIMLPVLIVCGLILPENFSTAAMLFVSCLVLIFIGRIKTQYLLSLLGIGIISLSIFIAILFSLPEDNQGRLMTWKKRIEAHFGEGEDNNYQVDQSKIAIASGGIFGKFPGNSTQRNFLPHPYSDFIFAIIVEEYGLVGSIFIVLLFLIFFFRVIRIATKIKGKFGTFITFGIGFSLIFQAMINMAVAVNILPVTGQTLPLVSMGGTSIWFTCISVGIILSVSREVQEETDIELNLATA